MILKNLDAHANALINENDINFHIINSHSDIRIEDFIQSDAIIFQTDRINLIIQEIEKIRRSDIPKVYLKPIFVTTNRLKAKLENDIDGVVEASDLDSIEEATKEIIGRISEISEDGIPSKISYNEKVLIKTFQYMYTRQRNLPPMRSRKAHFGYEYSFVRNILPNFELTTFLDSVNKATKKNFLMTKLIDRVNLCRSCDSSYLHFNETCHKCNSIDIKAESLIHHFRCAYIGPESDFKQDDVFVCPKCDKVLRHIGVDYDKPSEIIQCQSCNHNSQQSAILAVCIDCGTKNELNKLHNKEIFTLELTSQGVEIAKKPRALDREEELKKLRLQDFEIEPSVFNLLKKQEIKKTKNSKQKSYGINISFDNEVISHLVPSEVEIFTYEFRAILVNYMEDVDLMTMRTATEYELMLCNKDKRYIADLEETFKYNVNKILNDNFKDPNHQLAISSYIIDDKVIA